MKTNEIFKRWPVRLSLILACLFFAGYIFCGYFPLFSLYSLAGQHTTSSAHVDQQLNRDQTLLHVSAVFGVLCLLSVVVFAAYAIYYGRPKPHHTSNQ